MHGWRHDVSIIRELYTGEQTEGWRNDWIAVARKRGNNPQNWREAISMMVQEYNIQPSGWRNNISNIAQALGSNKLLPWRLAIRYIRQQAEESSPELTGILQFFDSKGNTLFDSTGYALFVRD